MRRFPVGQARSLLMPIITRSLMLSLCLTAFPLAKAEVVRVEITERSDLDATGYEQLVGRLHFEIDPAHPRNRIIADVELAPTNAAGRVAFSSDFRLLKPKVAGRGNGAVWVEIPNRGGQSGLTPFISQHGFTLLQVGWEFDVPAQAGKLRIAVPVAREKDGRPIRGVVRATFTPDKRVEQFTVGDLAAYPPVDAAGPDSRLFMRTSSPFPAGQELPRSQWKLEGQRVSLTGGFEPGKTYELAYLSENPPVAGLGLAAIRDAVAWLKHNDGTLLSVHHAYAFGSSQCGSCANLSIWASIPMKRAAWPWTACWRTSPEQAGWTSTVAGRCRAGWLLSRPRLILSPTRLSRIRSAGSPKACRRIRA